MTTPEPQIFPADHPDARPEVQAAWQECVRLREEAERLCEISNDDGTPEGKGAWLAAHDAEVAARASYERYRGAWFAAAPEPEARVETDLEAEP